MDDPKPIDVEIANLLYEDFRYKHTAFWQIFYRVSFINAAILVFPFVTKPEIKIGNDILLFFPALAACVTVIGAWIMHGEQSRLQRAAEKAYAAIDGLISNSALSGDVEIYDDFIGGLDFFASAKVSKLMVKSVLIGGLAMSSIETIILFSQS